MSPERPFLIPPRCPNKGPNAFDVKIIVTAAILKIMAPKYGSFDDQTRGQLFTSRSRVDVNTEQPNEFGVSALWIFSSIYPMLVLHGGLAARKTRTFRGGQSF
jgi:hypothetical protein